MNYYCLLFALSIMFSCQSRVQKSRQPVVEPDLITAQQIGNYVVHTFEDSRGNLWFGTLEFGVARYDGKTLTYLTDADGLPSDRVTKITEDKSGNLWFATGHGLSKYDGHTFTNFSENDGLCNNMISELLFDSNGTLWIGTWGGVCTFDGQDFETFPLPIPEVTTLLNNDTKGWITCIIEDDQGNIWFGRDGYGICIYDGKNFRSILKSDGLHSNHVTEIQEDTNRDIWIGTRVAEKDNPDPANRKGEGGVNKYTGSEMIQFSEIAGFTRGDVFEIYEDPKGHLWVSTIQNGVYEYDGDTFNQHSVPISIMSILQDRKGAIWLGGAGGLYKITGQGEVINVRRDGPW